jgi:beta-lactamase class A
MNHYRFFFLRLRHRSSLPCRGGFPSAGRWIATSLFALIVLTQGDVPFHAAARAFPPNPGLPTMSSASAPQPDSSPIDTPQENLQVSALADASLLGKLQSDEGFNPASAWIETAPSDLDDLFRDIESTLREAPSGEWSVYIEDLDRGDVLSIRGEEILHPASTIKLAIAMDLLRWMDEHPDVSWQSGPPNAGRNYAQLLHALLVWSEEDAAAILTSFLDALPDHSLNNQIQEWGAGNSSVTPRRATAKDLAKLLIRLERGQLLSDAGTDRMLSILREPSNGDDERLGGGLPDCLRTSLAHKTGTTFERGLGVVGDVGLVRTDDVSYVIAVIGNQVEWVDFEEAKAMIAAISRRSFTTFQLLASPPTHQQEGCYLKICPKVVDNLLFCQDGLHRLP